MVEGGAVSISALWVIGIHSIVARCRMDSHTIGASSTRFSWTAVGLGALLGTENARDAARESDATPKGAWSIASADRTCVSGGCWSLAPSGNLTARERHLGLSAAQRLEQTVSCLTSVIVSCLSLATSAWPAWRTAMKIISSDGKRTEAERGKIFPS